MPALLVTQGTESGSVSGHQVLTAAHVADGLFGVTLAPGGAWSEGQLQAAVMVQTTDALGGTSVLRRFPFFGSDVTEYADQGYSFDPVLTVDVTAAAPTAPTSAAPSRTCAHTLRPSRRA